MLTAADVLPTQLLPTGQWQVSYADDGCVLSRTFDSGGSNYDFALTFEPVNPSAWLRIHSFWRIKCYNVATRCAGTTQASNKHVASLFFIFNNGSI